MTTAQTDSVVKQALLEKLHHEVVPQLELLVRTLPEALADCSQAETMLRQGLLDLAGCLLALWGQTADPQTARPCCPQCGMPMRHRGLVDAKVTTTVGDVSYRRPRWRCETCATESYPHDEVLRFLNHRVSWPLAKVCSRLAAQLPSFEEARDNLKEDYGVPLATETVREVAEAAGQKVLEQEHAYRQRVMTRAEPLPESAKTPAKAYVFADGTTVHSEGDWHEIRVITVATETQTGNPAERDSRAAFMEVDEVAWSLLLLARSLGYQNATQRAFIADGAAWLWKIQENYFPSAEPILDWYHLAEKVHAAATALHGAGTEPAKAWSKVIKDELWEGRAAQVIPKVRAEFQRVRAALKQEKLHELLTYLENNQQHMDYPRYRALGFAIGSGQVEAQCKTLVGGRCKQAGMRNWTYAGAEAILRLRAAKQNKGFDKLWASKLSLAA
jgi:hypothetical protein